MTLEKGKIHVLGNVISRDSHHSHEVHVNNTGVFGLQLQPSFFE